MRGVQEGMVKTRADLLFELIGVGVVHSSPFATDKINDLIGIDSAFRLCHCSKRL
jgi:hypothetical protein